MKEYTKNIARNLKEIGRTAGNKDGKITDTKHVIECERKRKL